jgi:ABC-type multidrug transport system ATPase subunit
MINATEGNVIINGKDIKKETEEVRKNTGLCPQHNLLFLDLTVREHLKFLAMVRNLFTRKFVNLFSIFSVKRIRQH